MSHFLRIDLGVQFSKFSSDRPDIGGLKQRKLALKSLIDSENGTSCLNQERRFRSR